MREPNTTGESRGGQAPPALAVDADERLWTLAVILGLLPSLLS